MAIRQIFKNDAECLYKKCRPVERFDKKLSDLRRYGGYHVQADGWASPPLR